jgi:ribosomal protein S18 acetylase RimI-like enzyme
MEMEIKPIGPELLDDFLSFFDRVAFTDNPDWASCYCYYYHIDCSDAEWAGRSKEENREGARQLVHSGKLNGYLAFTKESTVGWCNANDRASYDRLIAQREFRPWNDEKVGSIVCFIIAPGYRRKGIARMLLEAACLGFAEKGYEYVEAYPRRKASTDAQHYHGPLPLYEKAGFKIYKEFPDYWVVWKKISHKEEVEVGD